MLSGRSSSRGSRQPCLGAAVALATVLSVSACGAGAGTETALPPGPPTSAPPGNAVLYVAQAQGGRVDAFRLGSDGLLPNAPFSSINLLNPRRLLVGDGVLYVAMLDRVVSLELGNDGSLPQAATASTIVRPGMEAMEMRLRDGILYVAASGLSAVQAYRLDRNGQVPAEPSSSGASAIPAGYRTIDIEGDFLYAASRDQAIIDTYFLGAGGDIPAEPEPQLPQAFVALPDDLEVVNGVLYVTGGGDENLEAYQIRDNGLLDNLPDSRTAAREFYTHMDFYGDKVYATAFNRGKIDVYGIDPVSGQFADRAEPLSSTREDTASFPTAIAIYANVLYVAQAGLGRVDAYIIGNDGLLNEFPSSSTRSLTRHFPTDVAVFVLP